MARTHYHVFSGLQGGYLPNTNDVYTSKRAALAAGAEMAREYRENGEKVRGGAGYWEAREGMFPGEMYDYISVEACCETDCADEFDY
jgi:hypothetical protein